MSMTVPLLSADVLWQAIRQRTQEATANGALHPCESEVETIDDGGIRFLVRVAAGLSGKDATARPGDQAPANPFLPPDPALVVGQLSPTHLAVLNKFSVVEHHLLLVTRAFEHQETLLTGADCHALQTCLAAYDGLGIHNAGRAAGASQMHKHLQVLPLPLTADGPPVPIEPLFADVLEGDAVVRVNRLPFAHAFTRLPPASSGETLYQRYQRLLAAVGITEIVVDGERRQSAPYNLLVTRRWMLLVPRTRECFDSLSLNALAFAGALFARQAGQLQLLKTHGPFAALRAVSPP
jgi:ATP adenylyltransferase